MQTLNPFQFYGKCYGRVCRDIVLIFDERTRTAAACADAVVQAVQIQVRLALVMQVIIMLRRLQLLGAVPAGIDK